MCEHWDRASYGEPLAPDQQLRLTFAGDLGALGVALHRELGRGLADCMTQAKAGLLAATLDDAAAAVRAARAAHATFDFEVVRRAR